MNTYGQDAEHQVAYDLVVPANPDGIAAVIVLEGRVDALGRAALVITDLFGRDMTDKPLAPGFIGNFLFASWRAARVGGDDRDMPQAAAVIGDFGDIISAVHEVVAIGDASAGQRGKGNGDLTVVHRG